MMVAALGAPRGPRLRLAWEALHLAGAIVWDRVFGESGGCWRRVGS